MKKQLSLVLLCLFVVVGSLSAKTDNPKSTRDVILILHTSAVSGAAKDENGESLYKGIAVRKRQEPQPHLRELEARRKQREREQDGVIRRLQRLSSDIHIKRQFTGLIHAIAVEIPVENESEIRSWPEIRNISPNRRYKRLLLESNPLMKVSSAWEESGGAEQAGRGVKIGIIDTGIDSTHVMFDDEDYPVLDGYPVGDAEFANRKIIAARVFPKRGDTAEESTPMDRDGHGTHVASCAAGELNTPSPL
ncbi:MAG: hypothetical protein C4527_06815 [Candidatus Omnitrophota bacterium]|jgi:subtilisin family serine protease|nr:MAG: hypothetical protein C4527_06815 [Candidatus Omnitrophota bacterium]